MCINFITIYHSILHHSAQLYNVDFDRMGHSCPLFRFRSLGVSGSLLSICTEFLSNRRQRVKVNGAASEWIPIISGVPQGSELGPLLFILYSSEMYHLFENRLSAYSDDSTLLAIIRKPADRPAGATSLNRDVDTIHEWCNHWCMLLNPNKTDVLVISRSRTVNPPNGDLVLSGVSIQASPNFDVLGVKFDSKLSYEDHVHGIVSRVSQRNIFLRSVKHIFVNISVLLSCYFAFVLTVLSIILQCGTQLLNVIFSFMSVRCIRWPGFVLIRVSCRCIIDALWLGLVCCTRLIWTLICLFSELLSASTRVRHTEMRQQLIHWSLKYQGVKRLNLLSLFNRLRFECWMTFSTLCLTT